MSYEEAVKLGCGFLGFPLCFVLEMTPVELVVASEGKAEWQESLAETILTAGWLSAVLERQKRIPPLSKLFRKKKEQKPTGNREDFEALKKELGG
ncbi:hypothetical protein [Atrimonas thermophila]|uniref:hypothetical protein n=1 Tax=Atrimonas thermophila TaxID=3064161 RepID=UPI00399C7139